MHETVRWSITSASSAHRIARRDRLARRATAAVRSSPSARIQSTCSGARGPAAWSSGARTAHARAVARAPHATAPCRRYPSTRDPVEQLGTRFTARSGPGRRPTSTRPSSSRQQKTARSGAAKAASSTSRSSGWAVQELPSLEGPAPHPPTHSTSHPHQLGRARKQAQFEKHSIVQVAVFVEKCTCWNQHVWSPGT